MCSDCVIACGIDSYFLRKKQGHTIGIRRICVSVYILKCDV